MKLQTISVVRSIMLAVGAIVLLYLGSYQLPGIILAQQTSIDEAIKAVVRIVPQRCSSTGCQPLSVGSGAIIHPAGIILTAWHVTVSDPENLITPIYADDFIIEMTEDVRRRPKARYRAELIAVKPDMDLALLRIYLEIGTNQPVPLDSNNSLPTLPISANIPSSGQLRIMGYPPAGGDSIKYPNFEMSGFADDGASLTVQGTLSEGYSGGPVLYEHEGRLEIIGVVIRRRGLLGEVGLLRSIEQLHQLNWLPTAIRVWSENAQVTIEQNSGSPILQIQLDLHMLDFVNAHGRLLAYVFDADRQPLAIDGNLENNASRQLVLSQDFSSQHAVDSFLGTTLIAPLNTLGIPPSQLMFRLLLWDADNTRILCLDNQWHRPQLKASQVTLTSTPIHIPTIIATNIPSPTATPSPSATAMPTPTATFTITPLPQQPELVVNRPSNIRQGPGTNYIVIGTAIQNQRFQITGKSQDGFWWQVNYNGQSGWVYSQLVTVQNPGLVPLVPNPILPTSSSATSTLVPTLSVIPTPTNNNVTPTPTTLPSNAIILLGPTDGFTVSGRVKFDWKWKSADAQLRSGQAFELVFWKSGQDPFKEGFGIAAPTRDTDVTVDDLNELDKRLPQLEPGEYLWGVILVNKDPYKRIKLFRVQRRIIFVR